MSKRPDYPASKPTEKRKRGRPTRPDPPVPYPRPPSPRLWRRRYGDGRSRGLLS